MKEMRSRQKGFSLIELLIVVAIILIIAAIAIPNLMKSRMAANESSAVGSVRTINTAEVGYAASCPAIGYSGSLTELNTGAICQGGTGLIDTFLAAGTKSGYTFAYTPGPAAANGVVTTYTVTGLPLTVGTSGQRGFYSDQTGVTTYTQDGTAPTAAASPLQ
jgi:type IV pilus assembly protein PilA